MNSDFETPIEEPRMEKGKTWTVTNVTHVKTNGQKIGDFLRVDLTFGGPNIPDKIDAQFKPLKLYIPMSGWNPNYLTFFRDMLLGKVYQHTPDVPRMASKRASTRVRLAPFQALRLLTMGFCQRPLDLLRVEEYMQIIKEGKWSDASQFRFHFRLWLVDGQHRLWACALMNVLIDGFLMFGLTDHDVQTLDMSRRTAKDQLTISMRMAEKQGGKSVLTPGMPLPKDTGAMMSVMFALCGASTGKVSPTDRIEAAIRFWTPELKWLGSVYGDKPGPLIRIAAVSAALLIYERRCRALPKDHPKRLAATKLAQRLAKRETGDAGTATHKLCNYLTPQATKRARDKTADRTKDRPLEVFWKVLGLMEKDFEGTPVQTVVAPKKIEDLLRKFTKKPLLPADLVAASKSDLNQRLLKNRIEDDPEFEEVTERVDSKAIMPAA